MARAGRPCGVVRVEGTLARVVAPQHRFPELLPRRQAVPRRSSARSALRLDMVSTPEGPRRSRRGRRGIRPAQPFLRARAPAARIAPASYREARLARDQPSSSRRHDLATAIDDAPLASSRGDLGISYRRPPSHVLRVRPAAPADSVFAHPRGMAVSPRPRAVLRGRSGRRRGAQALPRALRRLLPAQGSVARPHRSLRDLGRPRRDRRRAARAGHAARLRDLCLASLVRRGRHRSVLPRDEHTDGALAPNVRRRAGSQPTPYFARPRGVLGTPADDSDTPAALGLVGRDLGPARGPEGEARVGSLRRAAHGPVDGLRDLSLLRLDCCDRPGRRCPSRCGPAPACARSRGAPRTRLRAALSVLPCLAFRVDDPARSPAPLRPVRLLDCLRLELRAGVGAATPPSVGGRRLRAGVRPLDALRHRLEPAALQRAVRGAPRRGSS